MTIIPEGWFYAVGLVPPGWTSGLEPLVVLYVGPDQILPLTSFLGAIVGILLMFWNKVMGLLRGITRLVSRREPSTAPKPEADGQPAFLPGSDGESSTRSG